MGLFKDTFKVGAGATLGNIAAEGGVTLGMKFVNSASKNAYNNYRSQYFDPVVREDLCDIMVNHSLPKKTYPFLEVNQKAMKKPNFFKRHKVFTMCLTVLVLSFTNLLTSILNGGIPNEFIFAVYLSSVTALVIGGIGILVKKTLKMGGDTYANTTYKKQLEEDGRKYWFIREYIRQALEKGQLTAKDAVEKISNTRLVQQFPDTLEELDAYVFFYQQRRGLI